MQLQFEVLGSQAHEQYK